MFQALADPQRREIVGLLRQSERTVGAITERLPIAQSGVSRHLRILRDAGFVESRADGQRRIYALRPEPFEQLNEWLGAYRALWEHRLDAFEAQLQQRLASSTSAGGDTQEG